MINNRKIYISTAGSRKSASWPKSEIMWSEFCERLKTPVRSTETVEEYMSFAKSKQDELKDVGGFVGGTFEGDRRKAAAVKGRDLITLDMDNIPAGGTENILKRIAGLGCAAAVYSTRKHTGYAPRLRVIVPLDRTATADEYEPAARKVASLIGMELCDPTTFEASRLMYWPSCCVDSEYVCEVFDKPFCSLDGLLSMYDDWHDVTSWPQVPGSEAIEKRRVAKQEDPTTKRGAVGAFCRSYTVTEAMDKFIPGMYEETTMPGRYTYTGGSTVGGAVVYDGDMFLYSHHATDPCSGQLVNAFDLIRLHMFGDRDNEAAPGTPPVKMPSYTAMCHLALEDKKVSDLMAREKIEQAREAFSGSEAVEDGISEDDIQWIKKLTHTASGSILKATTTKRSAFQPLRDSRNSGSLRDTGWRTGMLWLAAYFFTGLSCILSPRPLALSATVTTPTTLYPLLTRASRDATANSGVPINTILVFLIRPSTAFLIFFMIAPTLSIFNIEESLMALYVKNIPIGNST